MEKEIVGLEQQVDTLTQVLLLLIHRLADVDEIVAEDIVADLDPLLSVQEEAGKELLQDLMQGLGELGHDGRLRPELEFTLIPQQTASLHRLGTPACVSIGSCPVT